MVPAANAWLAPTAEPVIAPIVAEAASFVVVIVSLPDTNVACRLLAARASFSWLSEETRPAAVPNTMSVAVPPPVAAIFRVLPSSTPGTSVRACVTPPARPSALRAAALLLVSVRSLSEPVFSVILPPVIVEAVDEPVRPSIFASRPVTSLLTLISFGSLPVAVAATKVSVLPLTVRVSPTAKAFDSEAAVPSPTFSLVAPARAPAVTAPPVRVAGALVGIGEAERGEPPVPVTSEVGGRTGLQGDDAGRCRRGVGRGCVARQGVDRRDQIARAWY